jgi:hypothetical protein
MGQQLVLQCATGLNKQALVDCLMADLHGLVSIANKTARTIWAMMKNHADYRDPVAAA